jgi:hypothetical protein
MTGRTVPRTVCGVKSAGKNGEHSMTTAKELCYDLRAYVTNIRGFLEVLEHPDEGRTEAQTSKLKAGLAAQVEAASENVEALYKLV